MLFDCKVGKLIEVDFILYSIVTLFDVESTHQGGACGISASQLPGVL